MTLVPRLPAHAESSIHQFLRSHVALAGATGVVVGLSGGIDSALVARLAVDALGAAAVTGVLMPDRGETDALTTETREYGQQLGIETVLRPIAPAEDGLVAVSGRPADRETLGNMKARLRMIVLYTVARDRNRLVAGTGNKSEILLGYFTKHGDGGVDLLPIGDLYKTEVRELARRLHLPATVQERPPTAGLWAGQTDEGELGRPYSEIDQILRGIEELRTEPEIAKATGLPEPEVRRISERVRSNRHKRRTAPIPKLSLRTVGVDWRD